MTNYGVVPLSQGKHALVDLQDLDRVFQFKWYAMRGKDACGAPVYYAGRGDYSSGSRKGVLLHRFILNAPPGMDVDHIDRTRTLDCRRCNIRLATRSQNIANSRKRLNAMHSRYKGVTRCKGKWQAAIKGGGRNIYLGRFANEDDAAAAYNAAATLHFGEFALLNNVVPPAG